MKWLSYQWTSLRMWYWTVSARRHLRRMLRKGVLTQDEYDAIVDYLEQPDECFGCDSWAVCNAGRYLPRHLRPRCAPPH